MQTPPLSALLEGLAQCRFSNERKSCVSGSPLQEDRLGGHHILPDRPPVIWIHQFRTWPHVCTGGGEQMKGLSPNWAASSPHMFAQLAKWRECRLVPSAENQLVWSAHIWPGMMLILGKINPGKLPGRDDSQGFRHLFSSLGTVRRQRVFRGPPNSYRF